MLEKYSGFAGGTNVPPACGLGYSRSSGPCSVLIVNESRRTGCFLVVRSA
ncbi:hypothetical protein [[Clostridium] hylemonae]|nr:hypothetical protein [[Clostridium] hylemonae]